MSQGKFYFQFTSDEIATILQALNSQPYGEVRGLINNIHSQMDFQDDEGLELSSRLVSSSVLLNPEGENVGINTDNPVFPLHVEGKIIAHDIILRTSGGASVSLIENPENLKGFGFTVDIEDNIAIVGARYNNRAVIVQLNEESGEWESIKVLSPADFDQNDTPEGGAMGRSVSISGDTVAVGDNQNNLVYVYGKDENGSFAPVTILRADSDRLKQDFGVSIKVFNNAIAVGASQESTQGDISESAGTVYFFQLIEGEWKQMGGALKAIQFEEVIGTPGQFFETYRDRFGYSVELSETTLAVGAFYEDPRQTGAVYIYQRMEGEWMPYQKLSPFDFPLTGPLFGAKSNFGAKLSLYDNKLAVGAPDYEQGEGRVHLYEFDEQKQQWIPSRMFAPSEFGEDVEVEGDAFGLDLALGENYLCVGAGHDEDGAEEEKKNSGSVYLFTLDGETNTWEPQEHIIQPNFKGLDFEETKLFGIGLACSGNTILIGAPGYREETNGQVFAFSMEGEVYQSLADFLGL